MSAGGGLPGHPMLKGLNDQQVAVVTTIDGPVICVAGAGSGKTRVVTTRAAWMIEQGIRPEEILLMTFTRAAAAAMIDRARRLRPEADRIAGGTFHSIASSLVRRAHHVFGLQPNFSILDAGDAVAVTRRVLSEHRRNTDKLPQARTVQKIVSYATNTATTIADAVEDRFPKWLHCAEDISALRDAYVAYKLERGLLDFDDLLLYLAELLHDPQTGPVVRAAFPRVMVDEHQDSNVLQMRIIEGFAGGRPDPHIMVVGDPAQSIYRFRGAAPQTMMKFARLFPAARVMPLEINYRSTAPILDVANRIDRAMRGRFERNVRTGRPEVGKRPVLITVKTPRHQARELCRRILDFRHVGIGLDDQAVLARSIRMLRLIESELLASRVSYRVVGGIRIDEATHIKELLSLARISENPANEPAWITVLQLFPGVGEKTAEGLASQLIQFPSADLAANALADRRPGYRHRFAPLVAALSVLADPGALRSNSSRLDAALDALSGILEDRYGDEWLEYRKRDCTTVIALADEYDSMADFLAGLTVDHAVARGSQAEPGGAPPEDSLTLFTVHAAKGLEYKAVHVVQMVDGHFPSQYAETDEDLDEELRILYVAVTRAKDRLLFYAPQFPDENRARMLAPSPFWGLITDLVDEELAITEADTPEGHLSFTGQIDMRARLAPAQVGRRHTTTGH